MGTGGSKTGSRWFKFRRGGKKKEKDQQESPETVVVNDSPDPGTQPGALKPISGEAQSPTQGAPPGIPVGDLTEALTQQGENPHSGASVPGQATPASRAQQPPEQVLEGEPSVGDPEEKPKSFPPEGEVEVPGLESTPSTNQRPGEATPVQEELPTTEPMLLSDGTYTQVPTSYESNTGEQGRVHTQRIEDGYLKGVGKESQGNIDYQNKLWKKLIDEGEDDTLPDWKKYNEKIWRFEDAGAEHLVKPTPRRLADTDVGILFLIALLMLFTVLLRFLFKKCAEIKRKVHRNKTNSCQEIVLDVLKPST